ncbi:DUF402 domain-containing protein [Sulfurisphaera ohwakuensis]|uniref:DUF402 domain-containing protein n=1 Tax=Sulfurisphaera ohwakuensis TaxID=69656 RepID=UPI0036F2CA3D
MKVRIRGIYATALTKLFLDNGFEIVQATPQISERFSLPIKDEPSDVTVKDGNDKGELISIGEDIYSFLRKTFQTSFVWKSPVKLYSVIETNNCKFMDYQVEPCLDKGLVVKPPTEGRVILSSPKAVGKYSMVWRGDGKTFFSEHIRDRGEKARLLSISIPFNKKGYNVKWRSNAPFANNIVLKEELEKLAMRFDNDDFKQQGEDFIKVTVSLEDKIMLDEIRKKVLPNTIKFHHMLKMSFSNEVDEIEQTSMNNEELLDKLITEYMKIEHIKPDGRKFELKEGKVIYKEVNSDYYIVRLMRVFSREGIYDGLNVKKEEGDYDIVEFDSRKWYQIHRYYNKDGKLKGIYVNISTPPELLRGKLRYLDLEVDVVKVGDEVRIIDLEELEKNKEIIGETMYKKIFTIIEEVKKIL